MSEIVDCGIHGKLPVAFICEHLLRDLQDGSQSGFDWSSDENGSINGYCDICEALFSRHNWDWDKIPESEYSIKVVCEQCAISVGKQNGVEIDR